MRRVGSPAGSIQLVVAAAVAFGFVYVHPFIDGNGRLHRWLIHQVLAAAGYNPPGVVFPVSAAILRNIQSYGGGLLNRTPGHCWITSNGALCQMETSRF